MAINARHLRELVIRPILNDMDMYSKSAENLLMGIAAHESHLGTFLKQLGGGPARGLFQMEPSTASDIWDNYLRAHRKDLAAVVVQYLSDEPDPLITNLAYQVAMARIHLWRIPEPLPVENDVEALAQYWKRHWNTNKGAGTEADFIENYYRYVESEV